MAELEVDCPECGAQVGTAVSMDVGSFESVTLEGNQTTCQVCGALFAWDKTDVVNL